MPQSTPNTFRPVRSTPVLLNGASGVLASAPCRKSRRTAFIVWQWARKGVSGLHGALAPANLYRYRYRYGRVMRPDFVVLYIVAGSFTAALAGLTQPTGRSSFPATFISVTICLLWPLFLWPALSALTEAARRGPSTSRALATHRPATRLISSPAAGGAAQRRTANATTIEK
jgi:hypothetical protein